MDKKPPVYRRAFGRQVAVELPENELGQAHGSEDVIEAKTCDGELTIQAGRGKDCENGAGWDDWALPTY